MHAVTTLLAAVAMPAGIFTLVVAARFVTLGALPNDHFVHLARAFQVLHGYRPIRDFVDPGLPAQYLLSAAATALSGHTLLGDVVLHLSMLGAAAALTWMLARRASGSAAVALALTLGQVALAPRLYSAPKVFVHVVAIALTWRYLDRADRSARAALGAWVAIAFLFRHDHGLLIAAAAAVMFVVRWRTQPGAAILADAATAALTAIVVLLPWALYVATYEGLVSYTRSALAFSATEGGRTVRVWPGWSLPESFSDAMPGAALMAALILPIVVALLSWRRRHPTLSHAHIAFAAVLLAACNVAFLRDQMLIRVPDVSGPLCVVAAIAAGFVVPHRLPHRTAVGLLAAGAIGALFVTGERIIRIPGAVAFRTAAVAQNLTEWPWTRALPASALLPLARYAERCVPLDETVLVGWFAPEFSVVSRRAFAGGLPTWVPGYYTSRQDQSEAIDRIDAHLPRLTMVDEQFQGEWPLVYARIARDPAWVRQSIDIGGLQDGRIWIRNPGNAPRDPATGLPCVTAAPR